MLITIILLTVGVLLLFLLLLGVMRETVILRGEVTALSQLITNPPMPSFIGHPLPLVLADQLRPLIPSDKYSRHAHIILFMRGECNGCDELAMQVRNAIQTGTISKEDISCVVVAPSKDVQVFKLAQAITLSPILDPIGKFLKACEIKGTPSQIAVWTDNLQVFDYKLGGDITWIYEKLQQTVQAENPLT